MRRASPADGPGDRVRRSGRTLTNCGATDETCNGQDDDCNGTPDDGYVPVCVSGVSRMVCSSGEELEQPCAGGEVCQSGECVPPGTGGAGSGDSGTGGTSGSGGAGPEPGTSVEFVIKLPQGVERTQVTLGATGGKVRLREYAKVLTGTGYGSLSSVDGGFTGVHLEDHAVVQNVWTEGMATLDFGVTVHGDSFSDGLTLGAASVIEGTTDSNADLQPLEFIRWEVFFPDDTQGPQWLATNETRALSPGSYGDVNVPGGAVLQLRAGTYTMKSLNVGFGGTISVDNTEGPVLVHVENGISYSGRILRAQARANVLFGVAGGDAVILNTRFTGILVAPNAEVVLEKPFVGEHRGSFFGREVVAKAFVTIRGEPLDEAELCDPAEGDCSGLCRCGDGEGTCESDDECFSGDCDESAELCVCVEDCPCTGDPHCALRERLFFSVKTPADVPFGDLALVADGQLAVGPTAQVVSDMGSGFAPISNVGLGLTTIEDGVAVGGIHGAGDVAIMNAMVAGDVVTSGDLVIDPAATVLGDATSFTPFETVRRTFSTLLPNEVRPVPEIEPGQTQSLSPGRYATLRVQENETVELSSSGEYFFDALLLEAGTLRLDNASGPIFVYVTDQLVLDGVVDKIGAAQNFLVAFAGTGSVFVRSAFDGTLVAPKANVTLESPGPGSVHAGAFFGRNLDVEGAVTVIARPPEIDCQVEASSCRGSFACPLADGDSDAIPDCQEDSDDDPWTNAQAPNGAVVSRGPLCAPSSGFSCSMIDEATEAAACIAVAEETRIMAAGWSWSDTGTTNLCDPAFGFIPGWSGCSADSAISVVGFFRSTQGGRHCFEVTSGAGGCTSLFVGDVAVGQTSDDGGRCYDLVPGEHPVTVVHQGNDSDDEVDVRYCYGGDCFPQVSLPPDVLRPQACGTDGANCDDEVTPCESDSTCLVAGQHCPTEPNGPLFNLDPNQRVCVRRGCVDDPSGFRCSAPAPTCEGDDDCPAGTPCVAAGAFFGDAADATYCLDPICSDPEVEPLCGSLGTKCGLCACVPDCSSATCGGDLDDGCGGFCQGTCADPEPGQECNWDLECPDGERCSKEFGRCIDPSCFDLEECDPTACGTDVCPEECIPDYSRQECGPDPVCGEVLATCDAGEQCDNGVCRLPGEDRPELPPRLGDEQPTSTIRALAGSFGVSSQGKATYSIPLTVPPSVGGSQPQLALTYTGDTRGGNAGVGWNINVDSRITRCPKTAAVDGWPSPPTGAPDDAYCLDGQRLILVEGTPGESGAVYHTERESFRKVVYTVRGSGDTRRDLWTVYHKGGGRTYYGRAAVLPNTDFQTTRHWVITEEVSRSSVVVRYRYLRGGFWECAPESPFGEASSGPDFGEPVGRPCVDVDPELAAINYGGTDRLGPHSIEFLWSDYTDDFGNDARQLLGVRRLVQARVSYGAELLREYRLKHGPIAGRGSFDDPQAGDFLVAVEECAPDPVLDTSVCKPATVFDYHGEALQGSVAKNVPALFEPSDSSFEQRAGPSTDCDALTGEATGCPNTARGREVLVDANGDGLLDLLYAHDEWSWQPPHTRLDRKWELRFGEEDNGKFLFGPTVATDISGVDFQSDAELTSACISAAGLFDLDGDGTTDVVDGCTSDGQITWYWGSQQEDSVEIAGLPAENDVFVLDRDGDGYAELVACDRNGRDVRILRWTPGDFGSTDYEETLLELPEGASSCRWEDTGRPEPSPLVMDADADGVGELLVRNWREGSVRVLGGVAAMWAELDFESSSAVPAHPDTGGVHSRGALLLPGYPTRATYGAIRAFRASGTPFVDVLEHVETVRTVNGVRVRTDADDSLYLWRQSQFSGWQRYAVPPMIDYPAGGFVPMPRADFDRVSGVDLLSDRREGLLGFFKEDDEWRALVFQETAGVGEAGFIRRTSEDAPFPGRYFRTQGEPSPAPVVADFNGDGALDVLLGEYVDEGILGDELSRILYPGREPERYRLKSVTDGLGNRVDVEYDTSGEAYTPGGCDDHRSVCLPKAGPVVHRVTSSSSRGIEQTTTYAYEDARAGRYGRGWLGFGKRTVKVEVPASDENGCDASQLMSTETTWFDNGRFDYNDFGDDGDSDEDVDEVPDDTGKAAAEARNNARRITAFETYRDYLFAGTVRVSRTESPEVVDGFPNGKPSRFRLTNVHFHDYRESHWARPFVFPVASEAARAQAVGEGAAQFEDLTRTHWSSGIDATHTVDPYGNRRLERRYVFERAADGTFQRLSQVENETLHKDPDFYLWEIGQVAQRSTWSASYADGGQTDIEVRVVEFAYDDRGRVERVTRAKGIPDLERTVEFVYDTFGNVVQQNSFSEPDPSLYRMSATVFDAEGLRPRAFIGPTQLTSYVDIDAATGLLMTEVDANGVVTRHAYDGFWMPTLVETATGSQRTRLEAVSEGTPTAVYRTRTSVAEGEFATDSMVEYDSVGRPLAAVSDGLGEGLHQAWTYTCEGWLESEAAPHPASKTAFATSSYFYDSLGRLDHVIQPDAEGVLDQDNPAKIDYQYGTALSNDPDLAGGLLYATAQRVIDLDGIPSDSYSDAAGRVIVAGRADALSLTTYGPFGEVARHEGPSATETIVTDGYGRLVSVTDPDLGTVSYFYDAFDRVRRIERPDAVDYFDEYDGLDRLTLATRNVLAPSPESTVERFFYDFDPIGEAEGEAPTVNSLGKLVRSVRETPGGTVTKIARYESPVASPANRGLLERATVKVDADGTTESFETRYEYLPGTAKLAVVHYPESEAGSFGIRQCYDEVGALEAVVDATAVDGCSSGGFWRRTGVLDAIVTDEETLGNGVVQNLTFQGTTYALKGIDLHAASGTNLGYAYTYQRGGRLQTGIRVGTQPSSSYNRTYAYAASGVLERVVDNDDTAEPLQTLEYFPGQRLEQVTQRDEPNIGVFAYEPQQAGAFKNRPSSIGENNFLYDGRGNQIYREGPDIVGGAQSITYNDLNLPRSILTGAEITSFLYGPGGGRAYTSWTQAQRQTWHVGDLYEKQRTTSGTDTTEGHRYHVFAGGMRIAEVKRTRPNDAAPFTEETTYLHHDRLGTLVASTDDDGELTGEYTYGIFGQPNAPLPVPYGYTGHRYESELGLTDAGGRFYDQKFGIFLSPDPIGPLNGGSAFGNRYSYVGYDPINFIDPTGFQEYAWCTERSRSPGVSNVVCEYVGPEPGYPPPEPDPYPPDHPDDCLDGYCFPPPDDCLGEYCVLPDSPGSSGSTSEAKPRIIATDGQMFGVTGPTFQPTASELLEDVYTPQGTVVTCSIAGPGCSDGSGYVFGWTGEPYTLRGRELDAAAGSVFAEMTLIPAGRTVLDSDAAFEDRAQAGGEIVFAAVGGNFVRGGFKVVGVLGKFASAARVAPRAVGAGESAFSIASRGGRHAGFLNRASSMSPKELQRTAGTLQKRIRTHEGYIDNPLSHVPNWNSLTPGHRQSLLNHWAQEITTFVEQQSIVEQLLR